MIHQHSVDEGLLAYNHNNVHHFNTAHSTEHSHSTITLFIPVHYSNYRISTRREPIDKRVILTFFLFFLIKEGNSVETKTSSPKTFFSIKI